MRMKAPMKERKAVERLIERMYRDRLKRTGKLPGQAEVREMEKNAHDTARKADNKMGSR